MDYKCIECGEEYSLFDAAQNDYTCIFCGDVLEPVDGYDED